MMALTVLGTFLSPAQSTIDPDDKFAYGANLGWINLEGDDINGVVVGEAFLAGSAWGANCGWIGFGDGSPENGYAYSNNSADDFGVNNDGAGNLSGFAYGANIGWINFGWTDSSDPDRPRVDLSSGDFSGFAYSANCGWINLGAGYLTTLRQECYDEDGDGMADPWEIENFGNTTTADATTNQDKDGALDFQEYLALTDPNDGTSFFTILSQQQQPDGANTEVTVEFNSDPGRLYQIVLSDDLMSFPEDSGLGIFAPDAGSTTTKVFTVPGIPEDKYYRALAVKPLQPES